eukprot:gnl/Trimastix_PCT/171.p1 GENE.gnl/Trimastix_PCT/171~~gnl/Trimastix_PCT/171.p1  ORF type:complete len:234 (+),score=12.95 gnl/Trimastix_PCT/171:363-1064(+)
MCKAADHVILFDREDLHMTLVIVVEESKSASAIRRVYLEFELFSSQISYNRFEVSLEIFSLARHMGIVGSTVTGDQERAEKFVHCLMTLGSLWLSSLECRTAHSSSSRSQSTMNRLHVFGRVLGYRRSHHNQQPQWSLIELDGVKSKEEARWYLGKRVAYIYRAAKAKKSALKSETTGKARETLKDHSRVRVMWGKICHTHGNSGVVRCQFKKNLPPKSFGGPCRVFLYPHRA